jgi:hypothetical protein
MPHDSSLKSVQRINLSALQSIIGENALLFFKKVI